MHSPATEVNLIGRMLRGYQAGTPDTEVVRDLLGEAPSLAGDETGRLYRAFMKYDIPAGRQVGPATWSREASVPVEVVTEIMHSVPSAAMVTEAATEVAEETCARRARRIGEDLCSMASDADGLIEHGIARLELVAESLRRARGSRADKSTADHFSEHLQRKESGDEKVVQSHVPALDSALRGGIRPGQLVIIAGRPGMGKSAFGMGWGEHAALKGKVLIYSLEMSKEDFFDRFLLREQDPDRGVAYWRRRDIEIMDDLRDTSMEGIVRDARRRTMLARERGKDVDLVLVDHLGLVTPSPHLRGRSRENEVAHVSREGKKLAKELRIPVVLISQLNRQVESREDKAPRLSDLRDSGAIEQDADVVIGLFRPVYYDGTAASLPDEVRLLKVRQGQPQSISARFTPETCSWGSYVPSATEFAY